MSSWEDIANEVVPIGPQPPSGLATGANRGTRGRRGNLGAAFGVSRYLAPSPYAKGDEPDSVWGGREEECTGGSYYFIDRPVTAYDDQGTGLAERLKVALEYPPSQWLDGLGLDDLLFCDIETTGLSPSSPLFLIGTLRFFQGEPRMQLFLARTFEEEKAILTAFASSVRGKTVITFNGKSFDWPYIEGRAGRWKVPLPKPAGHFDVLFAARRRWRADFPNCRLQTLEMGVCGRGREGDIASSNIPDRYYEYLEMVDTPGKGAYLLAPIIFHNALDVLTMAELVCHLAEGKSSDNKRVREI